MGVVAAVGSILIVVGLAIRDNFATVSTLVWEKLPSNLQRWLSAMRPWFLRGVGILFWTLVLLLPGGI